MRYLWWFGTDINEKAGREEELDETEDSDRQREDEFDDISTTVGIPQYASSTGWLRSQYLYITPEFSS